LPGLGSGMILHAYCCPVALCVANLTRENPAASGQAGRQAAAGSTRVSQTALCHTQRVSLLAKNCWLPH
jgi:hypothetical protein